MMLKAESSTNLQLETTTANTTNTANTNAAQASQSKRSNTKKKNDFQAVVIQPLVIHPSSKVKDTATIDIIMHKFKKWTKKSSKRVSGSTKK